MALPDRDATAAWGEPDAGRGLVGVDVGGTHTDVQVTLGSREARGKALTTYDDFSRGVLAAIGVAAESLGVSRHDLLSMTDLLVNATTVVTNAITQLRGARVGVLVTAGFRDEFRFAGGPRLRMVDDHLQTNVPDLVERRDIVEIRERVDFAGHEVLALDEDAVTEAARYLVEERGVEAIAICFLSSYRNSEHEARAEALVNQAVPGVFTTPSHAVSGVRGEYVRWVTAVLNCYVHQDASTFLDSLSSQLVESGLGGKIAFFQGIGGGISAAGARRLPLSLLGAGPAAGAEGAAQLSRLMGHPRVLVGDMGGTSFDTGLIYDHALQVDKAVRVGRFKTAQPVVDVVSVGAGGGSVAWISERGIPLVGPRSAGSTPGPACYGRGGTEPTVTDAMVVMDLIDPENYLGGRLAIDKGLAEEAVRTRLADRLGWSAEEAAAAIHDLVVASMANAVREVSVSRGYDPREFVLYAYGGTLPWFAAEIARALRMKQVLIPNNSSVFCARGLLASDYLLRYDQTVEAALGSAASLEELNVAARQLISRGITEIQGEGFSESEITISRSVDMQFIGQVHALPIPLPDRDLVWDDVSQLQDTFRTTYERTYGAGTAWPGPAHVLNVSVSVAGRMSNHALLKYGEDSGGPVDMKKGERSIFLPAARTRRQVPVYDYSLFGPGQEIVGPAIIEAVDTTLLLPQGTTAIRDEYLNTILTVGDEK